MPGILDDFSPSLSRQVRFEVAPGLEPAGRKHPIEFVSELTKIDGCRNASWQIFCFDYSAPNL
jgi:hypothetical protein